MAALHGTGAHNFPPELLEFFGADEGAYSVVTGPEASKGHITITGPEAELIEKHFGTVNIHIGPKSSNPSASTKTFNVNKPDGTTQEGDFTLVFPKPQKGELHIYMNRSEGFRPNAGDVWYVYTKGGEIYIGSTTPDEWTAYHGISEDEEKELEDDSIYQGAINSLPTPKMQKLTETLKYPRNYSMAQKCLESMDFKCEIDKSHITFTSRSSGRPYMECHHIIPLSAQGRFEVSLDVEQNIVVLCPQCHRHIHHAISAERNALIEKLLASRQDGLESQGIKISTEELISIYDSL